MKVILLIDDEEAVRRSFGHALQREGYKVIEACSGEQGLEMARQQKPDLILSDINMPGGDGATLLQHIRADPELNSKQVVLMTGRPDLVTPRKGMEQGADDFLLKPVSLEALTSCVAARMQRAEVHWRVEDRMLTKLSASMASYMPHELITPLAGILGLTEILRDSGSALSPEETRSFHDDIHKSALRLHRTVKNYLRMLELQTEGDVAKELPGGLSRPAVEGSIREGIQAAVDRHGRREDLTMTLMGCPLRVRKSDLAQIVEELVDNAFKFSRAGTPVQLSLSEKGVLLVRDAGRGMTDEEIAQIGAFRQFDRKKYEQQGLGLGLSLVQKLAAYNGATFSIAKGPENGIEVRVEFQWESPSDALE